MRVVLVDDHAMFRQGLRSLLESEFDSIEIVGEAGEGFQAVQLVEKLLPDIVIMDLSMAGMGGLEATSMILEKIPETKVIVLSRFTESVYVKEALKYGAKGYINKDAVFGEVKVAIEAVKNGDTYLSPFVLQPVIDNYLQSKSSDNKLFAVYNKLSVREKEVFHFISKGSKRKEIAEALNLSPKTIDTHKQNIMEKLNLRTEADIIEFARKISEK